MTRSHRICVLGRELQVKSTATADQVSRIESLVNAKVAQAAQQLHSSDALLVAILALLGMAEDYLRLSAGDVPVTGADPVSVANLISRIDAVLS